MTENTDKNASGSQAGDLGLCFDKYDKGTCFDCLDEEHCVELTQPAMTCEVGKIEIDNHSRLRSALIELGHAMSKSKLDIAARYHMEVFWELMEER